ncbi:MAG TPA: amidohydrolase family protein, partial [Desertimonas sp.]|nr:amidohydrolase family protein [Desertimonas sp.]
DTVVGVIIDCHGHYTTAPAQLGEYRDRQRAAVEADPQHVGDKGVVAISDDQIRGSLENAQVRLQQERGIDLTLFSPRASWMGHHLGNAHTSRFWTEHCNELIRRVCDLYPERFVPVAQLPQSPGAPIEPSVAELRRCVAEMGFVGCNLNPDPSGGAWNGPPLPDRYWYPLYEALVELDVPAMIHVSAACNANLHTTTSHYLGADTTAFTQLLTSSLFADFPGLRFIIPHGGGAVPYHWGRFRGIAQDLGLPPLSEAVLGNVWFDTCVYHQAGIDLLLRVVPTDNILFASEMLGAVRGVDPETDHHFDDTRRYLEAAGLTDPQRDQIYAGNARRVFPRLTV